MLEKEAEVKTSTIVINPTINEHIMIVQKTQQAPENIEEGVGRGKNAQSGKIRQVLMITKGNLARVRENIRHQTLAVHRKMNENTRKRPRKAKENAIAPKTLTRIIRMNKTIDFIKYPPQLL